VTDPSPRLRAAPAKKRPKSSRPRWAASVVRLAWIAGVSVAIVVVFVFVFPTRTYLNQRHQIDAAARRLTVLNAQNAALAAEAQKLQSPAEIERLAREQYHMVQPGEKAYVILPAAPPPTTTAPPAPPPRAGGLWHDLTSWLP
jgi:cell division protein FtsB